jgi:hypothetical protein
MIDATLSTTFKLGYRWRCTLTASLAQTAREMDRARGSGSKAMTACRPRTSGGNIATRTCRPCWTRKSEICISNSMQGCMPNGMEMGKSACQTASR